MNTRNFFRASGFTLVETLMAILIVFLLIAILYASLGPARARADETRCVNNLRQIGLAIQMYRRDHDGGDPPGARTIEELGLPLRPWKDLLKYGCSPETLRCNNDHFGSEDGNPLVLSYSVVYLGKTRDKQPSFSDLIVKYGNETPLMFDIDHGKWRGGRPTEKGVSTVLVLKLNGDVERKTVLNNLPFWEWQ